MLFVEDYVDVVCDGFLCSNKLTVRSSSSRGLLRSIRACGWSCFLSPNRSLYPWLSYSSPSVLAYRVCCPDCAKKYKVRGRKKKVDCSSVSSDSGNGAV